ncbi:thiamine pyrophosphate-binding protein [Oceanibaculum pacificum]|uniref:thiamine pyrophosphate-binding protein n=1 Tax=Oceanibaculum pacificum TaxID=580166 RepID=UPI000A00E4A6|nr:thiamine pyrophosphate-binding protein [Oceanibaculum pacificum]
MSQINSALLSAAGRVSEASTATARTGAQLLVDTLQANGVDRAFCVPGESYLAVLDALHDAPEIELAVCRQEGGAAMMAEAYGKLTGRPGVCMVTRGPGATNASIGIHTAFQDSTPMILFVGQVGRDMRDREAFQELDYRRVFGQMAKDVLEIDDAARMPEIVSRAFYTATAGRPGPVVIALPEDMLRDVAEAAAPRPCQPVETDIGQPELARLKDLLAAAERPFLIVGGGGWSAEAAADLEAFATAHKVPVGASFRCQDYIDNSHPLYAGHVGVGIDANLGRRVREADLLIVLGARLGEMTTSGYTLLDVPAPRQVLVHVHADAEELGRVYRPDLGINASLGRFARALRGLQAPAACRWDGWASEARREFEAYVQPTEVPGEVNLGRVVAALREVLPPEAIVTNGAGNYATFVHRFHLYRRFRSQLAPTSGSMGYGLPAAVAAQLVHRDRPVVCFAGDGCFMMTCQEFTTAVRYDLPIVVVVANNGMYGTIRMHQERDYPNRVSGTDLVNPDFARFAEACGGHGELVERTEDFAAAFARARASGKAAIIELRIDPEALTPNASLSQIRDGAAGKKKR